MRAALASLEQQLVRATQLAFTLAWPAGYAVSLGYAVWSFRHRDLVASLIKNKLTVAERKQMAFWGAGALVAVALVYLAAIAVDRVRAREWRALAVAGALNRRLVAVLALPFVAALRAPQIETSDPIWTTLVAGVVASLVAASAYAWSGSSSLGVPPEPSPPSRLAALARRAGPVATGLGLLGLWAVYGLLLSRLAVANHHALNTRTIDLGYYDNVFYNSIHGRPLGCAFVKGGNHASAHFDPILVLLSPLYLLYPRAEFLLVLQSVWLGMGVVPAYLLGRTHLKSRLGGWVLAVAYFAYPALHGANLYEFHSLALIAPLVLWLAYFLEVERWILYGVTVLLLCLCREDLPLMLCFFGLSALLTRRPGAARAGLGTIAFALVYYGVVRGVFMPSKDLLNSGTDKAYSYAYYFDDLIPNKLGVLDVALSLVTNPMFVVRLALGDPQKVLYLLLLFVPLGFLPFLARHGRLTMLYGLAVCLLASRKPVFQIGFQYAAMIFPFAFALVPRAIRDLSDSGRTRALGFEPRGVRRAALGFVLAASLVVSWKFGALVENAAFRGGFGRIARWPLTPTQASQYAELRSLVDRIEPGASVLTTNRVGAHVSNRRDVYLMHQRKGTNYVLVEDSDLSKQKAWHDERVKRGELEVVLRAGPFVLYRSVPPKPDAVPVPESPAAAAGSSDPGPNPLEDAPNAP